MAMVLTSTLALTFLILPSALALTSAGITLSHPLPQRFPPVARVKQAFSWTFYDLTYSATTNSTSSKYTVFNLPPWLTFTPSNRSFSGSPISNDVGSYAIQLTATTPDGQSSMADMVKLAVTERNGVTNVPDPVASQLVSNDSAITSAFPYHPDSPFYPGVRVPPNWSFSLGFQPSAFTAQLMVYYSVSMTDGSPLPPWLEFNADTVTFDGVTPVLGIGIPSIYQVVLSGSDVSGYSDMQQLFNMTVAAHNFMLARPAAALNLTSGYPLNTTLDVLSSFTLNDKVLHADQVANVSLDTSDMGWLSDDPVNMSLFGTPPDDLTTASLPLSITGKYGDTLKTTVSLAFFPSQFTADNLDPTVVSPGQAFNISLLGYFIKGSSDGLNVTATFGPQKVSSWMSYFSSNDTLQGTVPNSVTVSLRARSGHSRLVACGDDDLPRSKWTTNINHSHHHGGLTTGTKIVLASLGSIVGGLFLLVLILTACHRCGRTKTSKEEDVDRDLVIEKWATETPAMEYAEKMGEPASIQMLFCRAESDVLHSLPQLSSGI